MIESSDVMGLMKVVYVVYATIILSLIGIYGIGIKSPKKMATRIKVPFYGWIGFLVFVGVGIHVLTFNKIPWVKLDLSRDKVNADRQFNIAMADYKIKLPENGLVIKEGQTVRFNVESRDYTYGFGVFRDDGSMVFQMQVVPGSKNDLLWKFGKSGNYAIRSTEYSGPRGGGLLVKNALVVAPEPVYAKLASRNEIRQN